ncbi:MAG: endopeptidase La [Gemmataceae bacterium]|nr:endopeptidase La [Gemmataceae bacterium]MDW8263830.1 endopeptidase La [Gemmataceae bacterium]
MPPDPSPGTVLTLPVLPLKNTVLFPYLFMPLAAGRPASLAAIEAALSSEDKTFVAVAQRDASVDRPGPDDLYTVGTRAVVKKMARSDETVELLVQGIERVRILEMEQTEPFFKARVQALPAPDDKGTEVDAMFRAVLEMARRALELAQPQGQFNLEQLVSQAGDPLRLAYMFGSMLSLEVAKEQALLEANSRLEALRLLHGYLAYEVQVLELRQKIASQAQSEMTKEQRDYMLRQQMRAIQDELGEKPPEKAEIDLLRKRLTEADLPDEVRKEAERELNRLERMPAAAPDFQLTRTYLELILELPWRKRTVDTIDLAQARQVLDEDHYDVEEIKDRILEHLAVLKLNPQAKAPILCFVGPPGVGKTSLGQSIGRAMGRKFERASLGGLHDEAELRGHRRTYIGAMPGRIIQAIRRAGVNNPVLMLDEVDKLGRDFRGDPAAALLEILDPAQNHSFRDNYLDLPFDLSGVFFITTANTLDTIPKPLLDRMEVLRLAGYSEEEKAIIARRYLLPRRLSEAGLKPEQLTIPDDTLRRIISRYTREAGLRQLEQMLGRLARKAAFHFASGRTEPITVLPGDLPEYLGPERFRPELARSALPPGVATGLAWTESGGEVLYVEASLLPRGRRLRLTGQLGNVMRESALAAQSFVWAHADRLGIDPKEFSQTGVHIHVPAGAVPKDGPSAGVAMVTALASLYSGVPARSDTAMTGEITLTGLVLPIGGVKEKVLAAHRAGIRRVILPKENEKDLPELPAQVRQEVEFVFVSQIDEVLAAALTRIPSPKAAAAAAS